MKLSYSTLPIYQELLKEINAAESRVKNALNEYEKNPNDKSGLEKARTAYLEVGTKCIARYHEVRKVHSLVVVDTE